MNTDNMIKNRRLLESLEYLDSKYIDEMFEDLKVPPRSKVQSEFEMSRKSLFKHWRPLVALAACLLLLSVASPLVSYIAEVIGNRGAGAGSGTTGLLSTEETTEEYSELETPIEVETSGLETPTEAESTEFYTPIVTESSEPESSTAIESVETEPMRDQTSETNSETTEVPKTETEVTDIELIDSGFDKALERYANMSAEEIYADVLKGGWVVIGEDRSDFVTGEELWLDFIEKSQKGEPAVALIAKYRPDYIRDDIKEPVIFLKEIVYNGDLFFQKCIFSLTNEIDSQGEYKFLKNDGVEYVANGKTIYNEAYYLTNDPTWTWGDGRKEMFSSDSPSDRSFWKENHILFTFSVNISDEKGDK